MSKTEGIDLTVHNMGIFKEHILPHLGPYSRAQMRACSMAFKDVVPLPARHDKFYILSTTSHGVSEAPDQTAASLALIKPSALCLKIVKDDTVKLLAADKLNLFLLKTGEATAHGVTNLSLVFACRIVWDLSTLQTLAIAFPNLRHLHIHLDDKAAVIFAIDRKAWAAAWRSLPDSLETIKARQTGDDLDYSPAFKFSVRWCKEEDDRDEILCSMGRSSMRLSEIPTPALESFAANVHTLEFGGWLAQDLPASFVSKLTKLEVLKSSNTPPAQIITARGSQLKKIGVSWDYYTEVQHDGGISLQSILAGFDTCKMDLLEEIHMSYCWCPAKLFLELLNHPNIPEQCKFVFGKGCYIAWDKVSEDEDVDESQGQLASYIKNNPSRFSTAFGLGTEDVYVHEMIPFAKLHFLPGTAPVGRVEDGGPGWKAILSSSSSVFLNEGWWVDEGFVDHCTTIALVLTPSRYKFRGLVARIREKKMPNLKKLILLCREGSILDNELEALMQETEVRRALNELPAVIGGPDGIDVLLVGEQACIAERIKEYLLPMLREGAVDKDSVKMVSTMHIYVNDDMF